ncbi:hypothetical protein E6B08_17440 [Pseudomonas putida]|uniref:Site-specific integrase n=1 Tax=Pseudomonas putida TaxID=303 RepID=A0A4D6XB15_PSEPU|nr:hypothetical protein [Pseudomonas putida]QCI13044.1 hypothetical protein E6B08_17440 [Pseudomonas putida]
MSELQAFFFDENRKRDDIYDFAAWGVSQELLLDLRSAFIDLTGAYKARSRRQAWRSVRKFLDYIEGNTDFSSQMLRNFGTLEEQQLLLGTCQSHYNFVSRMVRWLSEHSDNKIWSSQQYEYRKFTRELKSSRSKYIGPEELAEIVRICKKEISQIRSRLEVRRTILEGGKVKHSELTENDVQSLKFLINLESNGVWSQRQLAQPGTSRLSHVGLRRLQAFRELNPRSILPIYLLMMIETAANPISLLEIKTNCVESHPTDNSLSIVSWDKPRASNEQRVSFLKQGQFSIAALVDLTLSGTENIRRIAGVDEDLLFITRSGSKVKRVSIQGIHDQLTKFRAEYSLHKFSFVDIRKSIAELMNGKHRSQAHVAHMLQHNGLSTVLRYINPRENHHKAFERISKIQGEMIRIATVVEADKLPQTLFGFSCGRESEAKDCLEFTNCAVCKNALVIIDDPRYVARILKSKLFLEEMESSSALQADKIVRFNHVYKSTLELIRGEIIPKITKGVIAKAEALISETPDLPRMY